MLSGKLSNIDCLRGIPTIDNAINYLSSKTKTLITYHAITRGRV